MKEISSREEILESWFFEAPVYVNGVIQVAPPEAIQKLEDLKLDWLPNCPSGKYEKPLIKLYPIFRTEPNGWQVETAIRYIS